MKRELQAARTLKSILAPAFVEEIMRIAWVTKVRLRGDVVTRAAGTGARPNRGSKCLIAGGAIFVLVGATGGCSSGDPAGAGGADGDASTHAETSSNHTDGDATISGDSGANGSDPDASSKPDTALLDGGMSDTGLLPDGGSTTNSDGGPGSDTGLPDGGSPSDTGADGGPQTIACGTKTCASVMVSTFGPMPPCCVLDETNACGASLVSVGGQCASTTPGPVDNACPAASVGGTTVNGCCRVNHKCGIDMSIVGLGCDDAASIGITNISEPPCGLDSGSPGDSAVVDSSPPPSDGGGDAHADAGVTVTCGTATCSPVNVSGLGVMAPCCPVGESNACGATLPAAGGCASLTTAPVDGTCPSQSNPAQVNGCCRFNHMCGLDMSPYGLGCVDSVQLGGSSTPQACGGDSGVSDSGSNPG